jgi:hypothetical protein
MRLADIAVCGQGRDFAAAVLRVVDPFSGALLAVDFSSMLQPSAGGQLRLGASLEPLTTASSGRARSLFVEPGREDNADKVP